MDVRSHQVANKAKYETVTGNGILSGKGVRNDRDSVVAAFPCPGMASVQMGIIGQLESRGGERCQTLPQQGFDFGGLTHQAGRTFLKGLIVTRSYTPAET